MADYTKRANEVRQMLEDELPKGSTVAVLGLVPETGGADVINSITGDVDMVAILFQFSLQRFHHVLSFRTDLPQRYDLLIQEIEDAADVIAAGLVDADVVDSAPTIAVDETRQ